MQCTFCGLAPDMTYRRMASSEVADAVVTLHERYGARRFFMVDLIIPPEFRTEVAPALRERAPFDAQFFFEMKPTLTREEFGELVDAGVVWMQPGIETLADGPETDAEGCKCGPQSSDSALG
jgi:magnesium-protoporphyrin IX monomethyl ester (oxidative) cyclase